MEDRLDNKLSLNSVEDMPGVQGRAAFLAVKGDAVFREDGDIQPVTLADGICYMPWGMDNEMPYRVLERIEDDETMTTCLQFNAELCYASGIKYDDDECTAKVKGEIEDFFLDNGMSAYYLGVCQDFKHFGFAVSVIILSNDGSKIVRVMRKEACYCRFALAGKDGRIARIYYGNWRRGMAMRAQDVESIELLDINAPWRDLKVRMGKAAGDDGQAIVRTKCRKFAVVTKIPTADSTYYPIPFYASVLKSKWYNIKQLIGLAKESKLKNSAPIRYHIEISEKYWLNLFKREGITDPVKKNERIVQEKKTIIEFLTGAENSGKAWFSTYFVSPDGKEQHEVVINKVDNTKEGGDWESDIQEAVNMICFAMRVHSNLVGSVPGKAQMNNSGSDKRELYTIAQALQKPYHDLLFAVHWLIIKYNGWKGAKPKCEIIQLTTLDEKKDAKEVTVEPPKRDKK